MTLFIIAAVAFAAGYFYEGFSDWLYSTLRRWL